MSTYSYSIKFILDQETVRTGNTHPIYAQLIVNRQKALIALHLTALAGKFDKNIGRITKPNKYENYLNNRLQDIENQFNNIRFELEDEDIPVTAKAIKQRFQHGKSNDKTMVLEFMEVVMSEMAAKPQEFGRHVLRHYAQCRDKLKEYLATIKLEDIAIDKFTRRHIDGFELFMLTTPSKVTGRPLCRNSANTALKKLKSVFNNAIRKELIQKNPFFGFKLVGVKSTKVALSYEEILALSSNELGGNKSLQTVRDIFLFSCFTGLRYGDAIRLNQKDVVEDRNGRFWIMATQQKTGNIIQIPMLAPAKVIYDKYETNRKITGFILPSFSNQKINAYLKHIGNMVGIKTPLTHHIGRHSYAVLLMNNGVDYKVVSEMMGHYSIRSTETYGKVSKTLLAKTADRVEAELK